MKDIYNTKNIPSCGDLLTMSDLLGDIMMFLVKLMDLWVLTMVKEG